MPNIRMTRGRSPAHANKRVVLQIGMTIRRLDYAVCILRFLLLQGLSAANFSTLAWLAGVARTNFAEKSRVGSVPYLPDARTARH